MVTYESSIHKTTLAGDRLAEKFNALTRLSCSGLEIPGRVNPHVERKYVISRFSLGVTGILICNYLSKIRSALSFFYNFFSCSLSYKPFLQSIILEKMGSSSPHIPAEVLDRIISKLRCSSNVYHCMQVNRHFYFVAHPLLYHHIQILDHQPGISKALVRICLLIHRLFRVPELAARVKCLTLRPALFYGLSAKTCLPYFSEAELAEMDKELLIFHLVFRERLCMSWLDDLDCDPRADALTALLLMILPSIEKLDVTIPGNYPYISRVLDSITKSNPSEDQGFLSKLTHLKLTGGDPYCSSLVEQTELLLPLRIPSIQAAFGQDIGPVIDRVVNLNSPDIKLKACSSVFQHLEFRNSVLSDTCLLMILAAPKKLESFIYEIGRPHDSSMAYSFTSKRLHQAISLQRQHVQQLWLAHGWPCSLEYLFEGYRTLPSLRAFEHLKHLKIGISFIMGYFIRLTMHPDAEDKPGRQLLELKFLRNWEHSACMKNRFDWEHEEPRQPSLSEFLPESLEHLELLRVSVHFAPVLRMMYKFFKERRLSGTSIPWFPFLRRVVISGSIIANSMY